MLNGLRVLVVEDFGVLAMEMTTVLRRFGCEVRGPAASIEAALAEADAGGLDAALLDVDLSGRLVTPVARRLNETRVPFVLTSGYERAWLPPELRDERLLQKPLSPDAIAAALTELLRTRARPRVEVRAASDREGAGVGLPRTPGETPGEAPGSDGRGEDGISGSPNERG